MDDVICSTCEEATNNRGPMKWSQHSNMKALRTFVLQRFLSDLQSYTKLLSGGLSEHFVSPRVFLTFYQYLPKTGCRVWLLTEGSLTQMQHMETIAKAPKIPAVPTIQLRRRNRITPRMFCRHGR